MRTLSISRAENFRNMLLYYRKEIILMLILTIVLFCGLRVHAAATMEDVNNAGAFQRKVYTMIDDITGIPSGGEKTRVEKISDIINFTFASDGSVSVKGYDLAFFGKVISNCNAAFSGLGMMLLIMFFIVGFWTDVTSQNGQVIIENMVKRFFFLIVGMVMVQYSADIVYGLCNIVTSVAQHLTDSFTSGADYAEQITIANKIKCLICDECTYTEDGGVVDWLKGNLSAALNTVGYLVELLAPSLIAKAADVVTSVTAWSRFIEISLFAAISPIMFIDIAQGRLENSNAMRSIKNIIALALSGAIIILSVYVCSQLQFQILATQLGSDVAKASDFTSKVWDMVVISVVQLGLVTKAPSLSKQIMGMA